jgi:hypothetical protein
MPNILLSGGAIGADVYWGRLAAERGDEVIHFSFQGHAHKSSAPKGTLAVLSQDDLNIADPFLVQACETLKRRFPPRSLFVANLLRRNYYQVAETESVYAISTFEKGLVAGGNFMGCATLYRSV